MKTYLVVTGLLFGALAVFVLGIGMLSVGYGPQFLLGVVYISSFVGMWQFRRDPFLHLICIIVFQAFLFVPLVVEYELKGFFVFLLVTSFVAFLHHVADTKSEKTFP